MSAVLDSRLARAGLRPLPPPRRTDGAGRAVVRARGRALAAATHELPEGRVLAAGLNALSDALASGDPRSARCAGLMLTGLGPGLTPLGDDVLTGAAAAVALLGPVAGMAEPRARSFTSGLTYAARQGRTVSLSVELMLLAARGWAIPPLHGLLDVSPAGKRSWRVSLSQLQRVGATSGRGCALGATLACVALGGAPARIAAFNAETPHS